LNQIPYDWRQVVQMVDTKISDFDSKICSERACCALTSFRTASAALMMRSGGHVHSKHLGQKVLYFAHRHATGANGNDLVVKER
jgi:hypothetical protein